MPQIGRKRPPTHTQTLPFSLPLFRLCSQFHSLGYRNVTERNVIMKKKKHIGLEIQKVHAVASETANNFSKRSILCVLQSFDLGPLITTQVKFILVICVLPLKAVFLNL